MPKKQGKKLSKHINETILTPLSSLSINQIVPFSFAKSLVNFAKGSSLVFYEY